MAVKEKFANSDEVREWAKQTNWRDAFNREVSDRGRLPSGLIEAFNNDRTNKRRNLRYESTPRGMSQPARSTDSGRGREVATRTPAAPAQRSRARSDSEAPAPRQRRSARFSGNTVIPENMSDLMAALAAAGGEGVTLHASYRLEFDTATA